MTHYAHKAPHGETRLRIYAFYLSHYRRNGYPPTIKEAADFVGVSQPAAWKQVNKLVIDGKLAYDKKATGWRAIKPTIYMRTTAP
jgi:DNA-binding Lrp family transcriptional regulator